MPAQPKAQLPLAEIDRPQNIGNPELGWASDAIAQMIAKLDFKYVSLVPGASFRGLHDSLVNYLGNANPQMIVCLHEEHAVAIAHGYAKVTDEPMAVCLHTNVGLMHATMAIFNAWCDRKPVVMFGANGPVDASKRRPWIEWIHSAQDQGALIRDYTKWDDQPASAAAAFESILRAYQIARTPPYGPTYVCLDAGLQESKLPDEVPLPDIGRYAPMPPQGGDPGLVAKAADWLLSARRPVILLGRVSRSQEDWDRRVALAEALGATVLTSLHDPSAFPTDHAQHPVGPRFRPTPDTNAILKDADAILSLDWLDLGGYLKAAFGSHDIAARIINCTVDPYIHKGWSMDYQMLPPADLTILSPPDVVVKALLEECDKRGKRKAAKASEQKPKRTPRSLRTTSGAASGPMGLVDLAACVRDTFADRPVSYISLPLGWPGDALEFRTPLCHLGTNGGGGVGGGPGIAVGAALALQGRGRIPVALVGDGDFLMGVNALWTASHARLPLLIVVANNRAYYNDVVHQERVAKDRARPVENKWIGQHLQDPPVDLGLMARAQGFDTEGPVEGTEALAEALRRGAAAVERGGRYFIDVRIDPEMQREGH
jgi:thiamine pyrophosphate-dependent acetolactate synthase large subunit-like protein